MSRHCPLAQTRLVSQSNRPLANRPLELREFNWNENAVGLAAAALANAFALEITLHSDQFVGDLLALDAQFIYPLFHESESGTRIVDLFDPGAQVGDFALHLLRHVP